MDKKKWKDPSKELPVYDALYDNISVEVIVMDEVGTQMWGFCNRETGLWYRTDGTAVNVKAWRYGRGFDPSVPSVDDYPA